ncbi:MAG: hypothetical protein HZB42_09840 [Sphingobacteriales bacterium]|nr:hypothetical protein [Sphingobacteriales bacterium]
MKPLAETKLLLSVCCFLISSSIMAQVKIGGTGKDNPHPSSVLELQSQDKGFLMPRMNQQQMLGIKNPADALVIYNTDEKAIFIYSVEKKQWMPLLQQTINRLGGDSCEWEFDTTTSRVFLVRGYPKNDSVFYNIDSRKFVFSDRTEYSNSLGQDFPVTNFPGKYYFKATASRFTDTANLNPTTLNVFFEVDSSGLNTFFNGAQIVAVNNPKNNDALDFISALQTNVIHAGQNTASNVSGFTNSASVNGNGQADVLTGISNSVRIGNVSTNNVGQITGINNNISRISTATGRVTGDVYGYRSFISNYTGKIDGKAYGIYLGPVTGAIPKNNYAVYTNTGHNRFGDSTLITDNGSVSPRAILDVNSTSAMITPAGTAAQRPASPVTAMLRYNSTGSNMEFYDGLAWKAFSSDSAEWKYDTGTNRVNLVRGLPQADSFYYNITKRKFVFADSRTFGTPAAIDDQFPGKYFFKATASKLYNDSVSLSFPSLTMANFLYEIDDDPFAIANPNLAFYNGIRVSTQLLPTATQKPSTIRTLNLQVNHTGADSLNAITSVVSNAFVDGRGYTGLFSGIQNNMLITDSARNNIGTVIGYRNTISMASGAGGRVNGSVYGYQGSLVGFADSTGSSFINGNAYGVFLNNINVASPKKNYAFYSNKGHNRYGDSTLITDGFFTSPRAVLDVNSTSAMITPAGTTAQRPSAPVTAMLRHNNDGANMEYYNGTVWLALSADTAEWKYDAGTSRVNLVRGLPATDTIFYNNTTKKFVFSDRYTNTNSLGSDFPVDAFNGKYTFKSTASKRTDSTLADGANVNMVYEVDNASNGTLYNNLTTTTVMNPKAFQKADQLSGIANTIIHAGNDSVQAVIGILNTARNSGNGKSGSITGIQNVVRIQNGNGNNTGDMIGVRTVISRTGATAGRVTGNIYGWFGSFSGLANNVDGSIYGIYLSNVTGAAARKNFAFYSNKGLNRLGDSVLITDGASITPRAVLDVNSTSAMVVPTGTSAQRPTTPVTGMVRYNTDNGGTLESYNGSGWKGILSGSVNINPPNIAINSGTTMSVAFTGATVGSVVSISPSSAPPNGVIIAWARVSAADTIEVRFENNSGAAVNPPLISYNVRIIQ